MAMAETDWQRVWRMRLETERLMGVDFVPVRVEPQSARSASNAPPQRSNRPAPSRRQTPPPPQRREPARPPAQQEEPSFSLRAEGDDFEPRELPVEARVEALTQLNQNHVCGCTRCELSRTRRNTVFGEGNPDARVMFVGEGPGADEDQSGRPFVGPAGQLLDKQIAAMTLKREDVFIANVVKCRPPGNRNPSLDEIDACAGYLRRQIDIVRPEVIITLGAAATKHLVNTSRGITAIRGRWHEYDGLLPRGPAIPVMPTFHPSYLLRQPTRENRAKVWADLQEVMAKLGLGES